MIGEDQREPRQRAHVFECLYPSRPHISRWVGRPGLVGIETTLDFEHRRPFIVGMRDDQGVMVHPRHVELHPVELQHLRHGFTRRLQFGVGLRHIELGVVRTTVVRRDHPG